MVLGLAHAGQLVDVAGQVAHGWLGSHHGADPWNVERDWSFVWALTGHREASLKYSQGGSDYRSLDRGNKATPKEGQASVGLETKSIGLWAFLIALFLE